MSQRFLASECIADGISFLAESFGNCTIYESPNERAPANVKRQNEIEIQFLAPPARYPFDRRGSPSRSHHTITLIRVSFIFRSPFLFFLTLHYSACPRKRTSTARQPPTLHAVPYEPLHRSSNFEVRRVFDVATNCSCLVHHAKQ